MFYRSIRLLFFVLISSPVYSQNWIDINSTIFIDDTVYVKESGLPYSGLITKQSENGIILQKIRCSKGVFEGKYMKFFDNGDTSEVGFYVKGKQNGYVCYYNHSNSFGGTSPNYCYLKVNYIKGIRNGSSESYFENGRIWIHTTYQNDNETGNCEIYFEKNNLFYSGQLLNGEGVGEWLLYDTNKTVLAKLIFKDKIIVSCSGECTNINSNESDYEDLMEISLETK